MASTPLVSDEHDKLSVRAVLLSEHPDDSTHRVYVKGQVVTTLRFEKPVEPSKTKMIGWIKNVNPEQPWSMKSARLVTMDKGHERAVAARATVREITPGGSGVVALVVDGGAFVDDGVLTSLLLEVYRHDGMRQAFVQLDPSLVAR